MAQLFEQISNDIKEAMKARDKVRLENASQHQESIPRGCYCSWG